MDVRRLIIIRFSALITRTRPYASFEYSLKILVRNEFLLEFRVISWLSMQTQLLKALQQRLQTLVIHGANLSMMNLTIICLITEWKANNKTLHILLTEVWIAAFLKIFGLPFCVAQLIGPGVSAAIWEDRDSPVCCSPQHTLHNLMLGLLFTFLVSPWSFCICV